MSKTYLCGVSYQHEIGQCDVDYFDSLEELKASLKCWTGCGVVELELDEQGKEISHKWVVEQDLFGDKNDQDES